MIIRKASESEIFGLSKEELTSALKEMIREMELVEDNEQMAKELEQELDEYQFGTSEP